MKSDQDWLAEAEASLQKNGLRRPTAKDLVRQEHALIADGARQRKLLKVVANAIKRKRCPEPDGLQCETIRRGITETLGPWSAVCAQYQYEVTDRSFAEGEEW